MTRSEFVGAMRAHPVAATVPAILALIAVAVLSLAQPDTYSSRAVIAVGTINPGLDVRYAYYAQRLIKNNYNPYADYFAVLARENPTRDAGSPEVRSTTVVGPRSITVEVVGLSPEPGRAAEAAAGAADSFVDFVEASTASSMPGGARSPMVRARIEQRAEIPSAPSGPDRTLDALVAVLVAAAAGAIGGLVARRRSYRRGVRAS